MEAVFLPHARRQKKDTCSGNVPNGARIRLPGIREALYFSQIRDYTKGILSGLVSSGPPTFDSFHQPWTGSPDRHFQTPNSKSARNLAQEEFFGEHLGRRLCR